MPKKKSHKKVIVTVIAILIIVAAAVVGYLYFEKSGKKSNDSNTDSSKTTGTKKTDQNKSNSSTNSTTTDNAENKNPVQATNENGDNTTSVTSAGNILTVTVISAQISGQNAQISILINQVLGSGTCSLTIGNYSTTSNIIADPQSSSCEDFTVPLSQIGSTRNFTVNVASGDKTGSVSGTIK